MKSFKPFAVISLAVLLLLSLVSMGVSGVEIKNRFKAGLSQKQAPRLHAQFTNSNSALAQTGVQMQAQYFAQLRKSFAQQSTTEEEAYLEIARKLMKLADVLDELEKCMDKELEKKYSDEAVTVAAAETPAVEAKEETPAPTE